MKKILTFILAFFIFCGTCSAFETPDPEKWTSLGEEKGYASWFDRVSVAFSEEDDGLCANVWVMSYRAEYKSSTLADFMINMEKKTISLRTFTTFTDGRGETDYWEGPDVFRPLNTYLYGEKLYENVAEIFASQHEVVTDDKEDGH